ncbi:glycosyltransferase-like 1 [Holotrichia oblita]|uniref:Glycosyltransferase-like 1 n=1 Tax=Holotrichia oblita TaxID=644536 RepID=A0ACB9TVX2_HOLOL|nr:glycosyltransferase-like 1 [Holotrichia oblita]
MESLGNNCQNSLRKVLFVEAFYGGSHKQLLDTLVTNVTNHTIVTLRPKKWHWRARCSALVLSSLIPLVTTEEVFFISSVVNLAELLGIRPDLQILKKIVYFHENQLIYPVKVIKERDIQYAYNQIVTCLAADMVIFNSEFNKESFLSNIGTIMKLLPDYKPKNLEFDIRPKSKVLYFPIDFSIIPSSNEVSNTLTIVWPHRWEFDKNPECFFKVLSKLKENSKKFLVSILGEMFTDVPSIFAAAREHFQTEIINFGFVESREEYLKILSRSHVVVSTADHEFFGVSILEATYAGCFPLAPNKLVYPEIYPPQCLYDTEDELYIKLCRYCDDPVLAQLDRREININFDLYSIDKLLPRYLELFSVE